MTNLTQQLEDKKKGCGIDLGAYMEVPKEYENAPDKIRKEKSFRVEVICGKQEYCKICKAEIAILEQAIAEMQRQRQNFIDIINRLLKQLNQPKEEKDGS